MTDELSDDDIEAFIQHALQGDETPASLEDFLDRHSGWSAQLPLPLRGA
jgi:hypothetical protein